MKHPIAKAENIMKISKLNNKGFAIESAIASGIVIFGMCTIITLITFGAASFNKAAKKQRETKEFRDEVADNYLYYLNNNENSNYKFKESVERTINGKTYTYNVDIVDDTQNSKVILRLKDSSGTVLTVEYTKNTSDKYNITKWNYGE